MKKKDSNWWQYTGKWRVTHLTTTVLMSGSFSTPSTISFLLPKCSLCHVFPSSCEKLQPHQQNKMTVTLTAGLRSSNFAPIALNKICVDGSRVKCDSHDAIVSSERPKPKFSLRFFLLFLKGFLLLLSVGMNPPVHQGVVRLV